MAPSLFAKRGFVRCLAVCVILATASSVRAAEIKMITSMALHETYLELVPQFEKASGDKVTIVWSSAVGLPKLVEGGEKADLAILPAAGVDELIKKGFLVAGSRVALARSLIGVAIRPGAPRPDLSSGEGLKKSLLASKSIVLSGGTSSFYLKDLFRKMGIEEQIKSKLRQYGPGGGENVGIVLARGDGDIGFQQVSEFVDAKGIDYVGPLPPDIQQVTVFSAGLFRSAPAPQAARALVKFLTSPQAAPILRKHGLEPG
jgi:molybdate transport system substrate-binding protein